MMVTMKCLKCRNHFPAISEHIFNSTFWTFSLRLNLDKIPKVASIPFTSDQSRMPNRHAGTCKVGMFKSKTSASIVQLLDWVPRRRYFLCTLLYSSRDRCCQKRMGKRDWKIGNASAHKLNLIRNDSASQITSSKLGAGPSAFSYARCLAPLRSRW